jgi:hypothetical protein
LTANHIVQSALVIGGTAGNPALVAIAASEQDGNPLEAESVQASGLNPQSPLASSGSLNARFGSAGLSVENAASPSAVPEPSTAMLFAVVLAGSHLAVTNASPGSTSTARLQLRP